MEVTSLRPGDILIVTLPKGTSRLDVDRLTASLQAIRTQFSLAQILVLEGDIKMEIVRQEYPDPSTAIQGLKRIEGELTTNGKEPAKT